MLALAMAKRQLRPAELTAARGSLVASPRRWSALDSHCTRFHLQGIGLSTSSKKLQVGVATVGVRIALSRFSIIRKPRNCIQPLWEVGVDAKTPKLHMPAKPGLRVVLLKKRAELAKHVDGSIIEHSRRSL